jgi:energy-coupling factor transporter ATP-binding protein EcfA2
MAAPAETGFFDRIWQSLKDALHAPERRFGNKNMLRISELMAEFPYRDLIGRYVVDCYGCVHAFYEVDAPSADVASVDRLVDIQRTLSKMIELLPNYIVQVQFSYANNGDYRQLIAQHVQYQSPWVLTSELRKLRAERLIKQVNNRELVRSGTTMVLTCGPKSEKTENTGVVEQFNNINGTGKLPRRIPTRLEVQEAIATLRTSEVICADSLRVVGIDITPMSGEEICGYFYRLFNPDLAVDMGIPLSYDPDYDSFYSAWLNSDVELKDNCLAWGNYYHSIVSMAKKPQESTPRIIERITTDLPFSDYRVTISIRRTDKTQEIDKLVSTRRKAIGKIKIGTNPLEAVGVGKKGDQMGQYLAEEGQDIAEANELVMDLRANKTFLVNMQLNVHLWHKDREELEKRREIVLSRIADMGKAKGWREAHSLKWVFVNSMPAAYEPFLRQQKVKDKMAADLIPIHKGFEGGKSPVALLKNASKGLVAIDLFERTDTPASLAFLSGATGSGKSTLVNLLIEQHLVSDPQTGEPPLLMIFDVGGSYRPMIELLGGKMVDFDPERPVCMNPLQLLSASAKSLEEPTGIDRTRIMGNLTALCYSAADPNGEMPRTLFNLLDTCVTQAFYHAQAEGAKCVTLSMLTKRIREFSQREGAADLLARLGPYTGETFRYWLDGPTQLDLDSEVVCFDIKGIEKMPQLQRAVVPMIINYIYDMVMRHPYRRKIIVMDEMWKFLMNQQMVEFVMEMFKTFRKENAAVLGLSQSLKDVAENRMTASSVVQNTYIWFLLDQGKEKERQFAIELLSLTEGQAEILSNLRAVARRDANGNVISYREALMIKGTGMKANSGVVRVELMPEEHWLFTTDSAEKTLRARTVEQYGGDLWKALHFLAQKHPGGLHLKIAEF